VTIATTTAGVVRGTEDNGVQRFAGIPYAAAPDGDRRWRPPAPVEPWAGERDATDFGATAHQNADMLSMLLGLDPERRSEDCLFLNVWTPATDDGRRPVMVWIHGGAFMIGSGSMHLYDGSTFVARGDVVVVTLNYRLGELGFLELGSIDRGYEGSGNVGLLDQVAALEWVRDNIAAFGGDPDRVTIFGESAGGMSVSTLLAMPAARGLFHRAIAQSGAGQGVATREDADRVAADYLERHRVSSVAELAALTPAQLMEVQAAVFAEMVTNPDAMMESGEAMSAMPFRPSIDGTVIPEPVETALRSGSAADVQLLTGTNADEWKLFEMMDTATMDDAALVKRLETLAPDGEKALSAYRQARPDLDPKGLFSAFMTDVAFRMPAIAMLEAQRTATDQVWSYCFSWPTPAMGGMLGSCHALEVPFVFDVVDDPKLAMFVGADAPTGLADRMQDAWIAFARTGRPGTEELPEWPAYEEGRRATLEFGAECRLVDDPGAELREFWESTTG
jgi:para-nitrobenzyl esterase